MQWLSPVGGGNDLPTGQERPSPFSQLVYTNNDSYIIQYGDLREIHKAASRGQVSKLQKMTVKKKTINLNVKDARKRTALHWACVNGHAEVVTFLVDRKCQLDVLDGENRTPLMKALQCQREDCANILVDSGAGLNIVDVYGNTALHYAVYNKNLSVVAKLLSHGAVVETQNKASLTPLLLAITKRSEQIVEFLLTKNANANAVNRFKCTALMLAVCHGSSEIVGMLLLRNVDVFAEDTCGMTAVRYAIACGFDHIHQQLLEYIRKLSKNAGPAGTSAGTPDEGAPLAERTPATAESLVEKTPDEAAPLVEATPATAESLVEKTPDEAAPLVEATPDTAESLVEKSPDEAAPLVEGTPATAESLVEKTPDEAAPDEAAPLVEGTPDKIECLGKATSGKLEQLAEETPRKITRPAKETYGQFICPVTGRLRKIAWEKKPRPVKTERVAVVTSNKTKVLEKGTSKMIACPTKETSTKASTNDQRFPTESKQEEDEENSCDSESLFESSTKVQVYIPESVDQSVMKHVNREVEEFPEKPSDFKPAVDMQNSVPNEAFEWKNEQTLRPVHVSSVESIFSHFGKQTIENSQSTKLEEDFNLATKEGATKTVTGQQENDIGIIEQAPQDQKNKMPTSESGQKEDIKSPSDSEIISKSAGQNYMCLPGAIYQDDVETINHKIEDQRFPTESKQEEDKENAWDSGSLFESSTKIQVCTPESIYQSVTKHINREVEEPPEKSSAFKPATEIQNSFPNEAFECKKEQPLTADQMIPSESKQKDNEENSWDLESDRETVSQKDVCLPKATPQKEFHTISGKLEGKNHFLLKMSFDQVSQGDSEYIAALEKNCVITRSFHRKSAENLVDNSHCDSADLGFCIFNKFSGDTDADGPWICSELFLVSQPDSEDQMIPSESKQKDEEENSWDLESDRETVSQKDVCLPKATPQKEFRTISGKLEAFVDQMIPSESKQKEEEENSWDLESAHETVSQKDVRLPEATPQKEFHTISGKLEDQMIPSESKKKAEEENSWDLESDRETVSQKDVCLPRTAPQKEFHMISGKLEDQMVPSESKQKDEEENSWDLESDRETVSQKDVCLPKATPQKEFHMISEKLEKSPHKDGLLKPTCGMKVSIPNKALEVKDIQTFKAVDVSSVESTFSPFGKPTTENSQPTKLEEDFSLATKEEATKTVTGQQENDVGIIEQAPEDQTNKTPTSESRQKEYTESSDSEIISVSDTQNYVCLTEATYQKEIKTINGKIEESTEKPSDFEPAVEMQNSVPNKALERRNKQTLRADNMLTLKSGKETYAESRWSSKNFKQSVSESAAQNYTCLPEATYQEEVKNINGKLKDSTSLSKSLDAVPSCKRARELKKDHCEKLTAKIERMKNKFCVLKKELSETKEINSQLENQTVKWEQELCSVRLTLNQEEEKRRNANILNEKIRKELGRIEEQHRKELEVKQELEQALRIQDMEVKSVRSNLSQVSHTHENENYLLHENRMLKKEIAMLKLEIAKLKHQHQEKENKYFKDIKILKEKNAELQMTLKLKEESLTKMASQYSRQLKVLMAENTMLTSKLKEKQDKEIREREIESYHPRLASAVQDRDQIVTSRKSQGLAFHIAGDASLQGKINVDVNNTIYINKVLHQPLAEAQRKSKSLKINLNYAGDALRENTLVSEHAQRERDEPQYQMKKAEHMYQNEQDNVNIHSEQQESLEQKLFQLQSKNLWLRQQLIHAHKKADNKSKITINIQLLKRKMQHHPLKEKNEEIFNYINHLKDCIYKYEKEKEEREVIVKQLQKRLADLNKQCVSDLTRTYTNYHINLKDEI
ncbi:ankyrin repeat domain-containing protein 30B-like [Macaca nemestrina]|uniref:ankyrin repeat domain-containing protein 30B-like n=1 Tax=Macaca nemestrina TaxID=9545 RepID=UPI0039B8F7A0